MHPDKLALCGLDPDRLHRPDRFQDNTKTHLINTLKVVTSAYILFFSPSLLFYNENLRQHSKFRLESLKVHLVCTDSMDDTFLFPGKVYSLYL